jgi:hypothetical protein
MFSLRVSVSSKYNLEKFTLKSCDEIQKRLSATLPLPTYNIQTETQDDVKIKAMGSKQIKWGQINMTSVWLTKTKINLLVNIIYIGTIKIRGLGTEYHFYSCKSVP